MFNATFVINSLPPSSLYPNQLRKISPRDRARIQKDERKYAFYLARQTMGTWEAPDKAFIIYEFYTADHKIRDIDGMVSACKAWVDGLVDAGVLINDDCWHLSIGRAEVFTAKRPETRLIIQPRF